jgi:hypothetical protein
MDPFMELQEANMNSNENIKRLREKRRTLENEYNSGSPVTTRKSADETSTEDSVGRVSSVPDLPSNNGGQKPARPSMSWAPIRMSSVNWGNTVLEEEPTLQNQLKRLESKIKAIEIKEMRKSMAVEKIAVEEEEKKDEEPKFPRDAYSFLALNGPKATLLWYELWPERKPCLCFLFGMTAYIFQAAFHAMMIVGDFGGTSVGDFKSGGLAEFFPPKTSPTILIAQFLSLLAYIAFPDSALKDLVIACRIFPGRSQNPDDPVGGLRLACILKATQGILGIANLLLLVMTSSAVYEIVLSFIIINFISSIDDHAFTLAENGMLGPSFKKEADMIAEEKLPGRCNDRCKSATHRVVMLGSALALFVSMFVIIAFQNDSSTSKAFGRGNGVLGMGTRRLGDRDNMELLAIQLDDVQSSRQNVDTSDWDFVRLTESQWRSAVPLATNFALDCDGKSVLTVDVDQSMVNKMQSVWVKEGSSCRLAVKNSTGSIDAAKTDVAAPEPIWHVNYTLSQGQVEILNQQSSQEGIVDFTLLPNCYFEEFENKADIANNKAIGWLVEDDPQVSRCGEEDFIERYALATMNFAMNDEEKFITREEHCGWNAISCSEGQVNAIVLEEQGLKGRIPSEIGLLTNLKKLQLSEYDEIRRLMCFRLLFHVMWKKKLTILFARNNCSFRFQ